MAREIPPIWVQVLERKGLRPTARALAEVAEISPQTATRLIFGENVSDSTVRAAAKVLGLSESQVWLLAGSSRQDYGPVKLPDGASRLNRQQREAVVAVINAMLRTEETEERERAEVAARRYEQSNEISPEEQVAALTAEAAAEAAERRARARPSRHATRARPSPPDDARGRRVDTAR